MDSIELNDAFYFDCPNCGYRNYGAPTQDTSEVNEKDRIRTIRRELRLGEWESLPDNWEEIEIIVNPDEVQCEGCGTIYSVDHAPEPDDLDEDEDDD